MIPLYGPGPDGRRSFETDVRGARVRFGWGARHELPRLVEALGLAPVALIGTPGRQKQLELMAAALGTQAAAVLATARQHVPAALVDETWTHLERLGVRSALGHGGGSAIGLAKALALRADVAVAAIPTTYSGSEMTAIHGITRDGAKVTGRDERVRPKLVIYDPELTLGLPASVSISSLFNALAHAAEALYGPGVDESVMAAAELAAHEITESVRALPARPGDAIVRDRALYGAHLAGACLDSAAMGLHHKLAHVLGGFGLPHAETHTVLLPHVLAYNAPSAPQLARLARAVGTPDAARGVHALALAVGAPTRLRDLGLSREDIPKAAQAVTANPYANPRAVEPAGIERLLADAWDGRAPGGGAT